MKPCKTPRTTVILGKPHGWDDEKNGPCIGLPIVEEDGYLYSFWLPSWRERLSILLGHPIQLCVASSFHPPVSIEVAKKA